MQAAGERRDAKRGRRNGRAPLTAAAIDLGTNNCRLLIGMRENGRLRVVDSYSRIVRLGEGVTHSGLLAEEAIERTLAALKVCADRLAKKKVSRVRAIATEACRRAANANELVERARAETGIALDIISTDEEARLAAVGCMPLLGREHEGALIFDIGGGSTELIWIRRTDAKPEVVSAASLPIGVVMLSERHGLDARLEDVMSSTRPLVEKLARDMHKRGAFPHDTHHLLGTSGTITTLAAIAMGLSRYDRRRVDASWHDTASITGVIDSLATLDHSARMNMGCVGRDRADLMLPGCAIFKAIVETWPCTRLRVADRGLREGILRELVGLAA